jgi:hypothetical protein
MSINVRTPIQLVQAAWKRIAPLELADSSWDNVSALKIRIVDADDGLG